MVQKYLTNIISHSLETFYKQNIATSNSWNRFNTYHVYWYSDIEARVMRAGGHVVNVISTAFLLYL